MRLTEKERLAIMKDRDENRPCKTCEWNKAIHPRKNNDIGCVNSNKCSYSHKAWEPIRGERDVEREEENEQDERSL